MKQEGNAILYSRRKNSLNRKFPLIVEALRELPEGTVVDGELAAMDLLHINYVDSSVYNFTSL